MRSLDSPADAMAGTIDGESHRECVPVIPSREALQRARDSKVAVLVVGYGPVGATVANLLAQHGVRTLVIDRFTDIFAQPRAIALDSDALRILQYAGLSEADFDKVAIPYVRLRSPLCGLFGRMNTLGALDGHPKLVTFYQPELERALRAKLAQTPLVTIAGGIELVELVQEADGVSARLRTSDGDESISVRYVVAADGANSIIRKSLGLDFVGRSFAQDWLIVDATGSETPIDHIEFLCDPARPTPHMIAPGGRERWEFMLHPGESAADAVKEENVAKLLSRWSALRKLTVERTAVYRFEARAAARFSKGRVFLAGDAAHITPPFAGQGLVAGLRDAANLSWKLAWVLQGKASPSILTSYDEERRPHARAMIAFALFMGRLVMPTNRAAALFIHGTMRLARLLPPVRRYLEEAGNKPTNRFAKGLFAHDDVEKRKLPGEMLAQTWLRSMDGDMRLSDDVLGPTINLIGFGVDPQHGLGSEAVAALARIGGAILQISHRGQRLHLGPTTPVWEDLTGGLLPGAVPFGWVALVRPDRTILQAGPAAEANRIVFAALELLGNPTPESIQRHVAKTLKLGVTE